MNDESLEDFKKLRNQVEQELRPQNVLEAVDVRTIVDLIWSVVRYRRVHALMIANNRVKGIERLLGRHSMTMEARTMAEAFARGDPKAKERVNDALKKAGLTTKAIMAEAVSVCLDQLERIERMTASSDAQRIQTMRNFADMRALGAELKSADPVSPPVGASANTPNSRRGD